MKILLLNLLIFLKFTLSKSDNCLVKLNPNSENGHFWQLCSSSLNLDEAKKVCFDNFMKLEVFNDSVLNNLFKDFKSIQQAHLQTKEIGEVYNQSLEIELKQQFCYLDHLENDLITNLHTLNKRQLAYIENLIRNTTDQSLKIKLEAYMNRLTDQSKFYTSEIRTKIEESKKQAETTLRNIIRGVNSDKINYINMIQNSEDSQVDQYIMNYRRVLFNRLDDFKNEVLDIRNKILDIHNLLRAQVQRCQNNDLAVQSGLSGSIHEPTKDLCNDYLLNGIGLSNITYDLIEVERSRMDIILRKSANGLSKIFNININSAFETWLDSDILSVDSNQNYLSILPSSSNKKSNYLCFVSNSDCKLSSTTTEEPIYTEGPVYTEEPFYTEEPINKAKLIELNTIHFLIFSILLVCLN